MNDNKLQKLKGTQNKATSITKLAIAEMLADYQNSGQMSEDFSKLNAKDRLYLAERLMNYVIPKQSSIAADVTANTALTIESKLRELSKENDM